MEVMEKGRIYTSPLFVMRALPGKHGGISAVAPKKVAATAVMRNKIRRQIYAAAAPLKMNLAQGASIIIFAKKETVGANLTDMTSDLKNLFVKAKISV